MEHRKTAYPDPFQEKLESSQELLAEIDFPQELVVNRSVRELAPFIPKLQAMLDAE